MTNTADGKMEPRDDELIRRYQSGDVSAFDVLLNRHDRQVLNIAARFTRCAEDAKDIYQEVFYRVYKGLHRFRFQSEFTTWLYRITTNVCMTHRTIRKKNLHLSFDAGANDAIDPPFDKSDDGGIDILRRNEINRRIAEALETLSPKQKMVFTLKHYEGLKIREIAEFMGCTEGTIKKYLFTAIDRLRRLLNDVEE